MKLKTSAIALAVAGTIAVPMSAQAGDSMNAWASIRVGLQQSESKVLGDPDTLEFGDRSSRFGFNAEKDLGNGTTSYGRIEWGMDGAGLRHLYAGLKTDAGDFRVVKRGNTSYYNLVVLPYDWTWWVGPYDQFYDDKTFNSIMYSGSGGPVSYSVTLEAQGDNTLVDAAGQPVGDSIDGTAAAVSFDAGPVTIGLGFRDREYDVLAGSQETLTGATVSGSAGDFSYAVSLQEQGDNDSLNVMLNVAGITVTLMQETIGLAEPSGIAVSYTYTIGPQTSAWFEFVTLDNDTVVSGDEDTSALYATLKFDWK